MSFESHHIVTALFLSFLAGMVTGLGSLTAHFTKRPKYKYVGFALGVSAGGIIGVALVEVLPETIAVIGSYKAKMALIIGMVFPFLFSDIVIKRTAIEKKVSNLGLKLSGRDVVMAIDIILHKIPEGLLIFFATIISLEIGVVIAVTIALHNIAVGFSLSMSIFYITQDQKRAFLYSLFSGLIEPIGALFAAVLLIPFLSKSILYLGLSLISGTMVYVSLGELIPIAHSYGEERSILVGIIVGMSLMIMSIMLLHLL